MNIIPKNSKELKPYWLLFHLNGSMSDFLEHDLPMPSYLKKINRGYLIGWQIDGYFGTEQGRKFLNDIIARFTITFANEKIERLPYAPELEDSKAHINNYTYKLNKFSSTLKSIKAKKFIPQRAENYDDIVFWAIKFHAEDLITEYSILSYEQLEDFAMTQFIHKERSTIRAKCRSIWNYYEKRDFKLNKKEKKYETHKKYLEETSMSRTENMIKLNKKRAENKRDLIESLITGIHADKYKKKNGKLNAIAISTALKISDKTVRKYLKEISQAKQD